MAGFAQDDEKIIDVINRQTDKYCSIEFFPPKTEAGIELLFKALDNLKVYDPQFVDVTWGAGGSTSELTVELCKRVKANGKIPNMHLTCTNMDKEKLDTALADCKAAGITNIFALRGDPPAGQETWTATEHGLTCALDLVHYIKSHYGDYFSIGVAGYPEGHPNNMTTYDETPEELGLSPAEMGRFSIITDKDGNKKTSVCRDTDFAAELEYLKKKVDAGASFIITQMFFDTEVFRAFVEACKSYGITVPILPGIMLIGNYGGLMRMAGFCKTRLPDDLLDALQGHEDDAEAVKKIGSEYCLGLCQRLLEQGVKGLHFYTLNASATTLSIMEKLNYPKLEVQAETIAVE